jgi:hypothetical protein
MDKDLFIKIWDSVFSRMGIGAIFLAMLVFLWLKMEDMRQEQTGMLMDEIKSAHTRMEKQREKFEESIKTHMEAINNCCQNKVCK